MLKLHLPYVPDLYAYHRRRTREVMVGDVGVGGDNPIRVQSMTTTVTRDIPATVAQTERLVAAGCEIVRITTPTPADARCLGPIKEALAVRGIHVPLVADIHFSPAAALAAAEFADKVRINPGNFVDSRKFARREYTDEEYVEELRRVEERFLPLVLKCKERGIAMRIGTNHGSLSDRIMNRFGDTPEGMVESALEFVRICESQEYRDIILSMKASNPKVMIAAYRLLAARMAELGMEYPFHLGVTEAGNAEDGRIKSAIGIGSLLEDGIGDTIRVSLTEEPEAETPVAYALARRYHERDATSSPRTHRGVGDASSESQDVPWSFYHYERRSAAEGSVGDASLGGSNTVGVIASIGGPLAAQDTALARVLRWASPAGRRHPKPDLAVVTLEDDADLVALHRIADRLRKWEQARLPLIARGENAGRLASALADVAAVQWPVAGDVAPLAAAAAEAGKPLILEGRLAGAGRAVAPVPSPPEQPSSRSDTVNALLEAALAAQALGAQIILTLRATEDDRIHAYRLLAARAAERGLDAPIILQTSAGEDDLLSPSIALGSLLCDGIGDAVLLTDTFDGTTLAFNILQAAGARLSKTDYVACPSCGRTLFDLQETTERIKSRTSHLVGVRLAIMGCIVNGPGEMADADFGYVGGAPGQVNLYVGKECVEKGVPAEQADNRLIELIKSRGKWQEQS